MVVILQLSVSQFRICAATLFKVFLYFRTHAVYPPNGYSQQLLLSEYHIGSLRSRRNTAGVIFLKKLLAGTIDCSDLLCQLSFNIPRPESRNPDPFKLPHCRTNLGLNSPVYRMCKSMNQVADRCDIFVSSISAILRNFSDVNCTV